MDYSDTTVVIPTLNEEKNIYELLSSLFDNYHGISIIVADDGSSDNTKRLVRATKSILLDRANKNIHGLTASVIEAVKQINTKYTIVMDGDMQQ
jgi:glycosyltransferase involved in cell wall biosynthesis